MTAPDDDPADRELRATKHQATGNDFLVVLDVEDRRPLSSELVRALCHRQLGVGADGVIRVLGSTDGADLGMDLVNADGSAAELSGNGLRCLAQAAVAAGLVAPPSFTVWTKAGIRSVRYRPDDRPGTAWASVDMGPAELGLEGDPLVTGGRSRRVGMGNPHLVVLGPDPFGPDGEALGRALHRAHGHDRNVELITVDAGGDRIDLRVWERGVGETLACGTGAAAAAAAAHSWGLVGTSVEVHNPGGVLGVTLATEGVRLSGPVHRVADVTVDVVALLAGTGS